MSNLLICDTIIADCLNNKEACDVILLDFTRAFDKVDHNVLCRSLAALGIMGQLLKWLSNFLHGRTQFVTFENAISDLVSVTLGVMQESVVGPQMFIIFANDIGAKLKKSTLIQFADDAKLVGKANNVAECADIQADLQTIGDWSNANLLPLSLLKCIFLHYGVHNENYNYSVNGEAIKSVDKCADLGVIRTADFKYNQHIASLCL